MVFMKITTRKLKRLQAGKESQKSKIKINDSLKMFQKWKMKIIFVLCENGKDFCGIDRLKMSKGQKPRSLGKPQKSFLKAYFLPKKKVPRATSSRG